MKRIIFIALILISLKSVAQIDTIKVVADSTRFYSYGQQFQARDLEQLYPLLHSNDDLYEDVYQLIQAKYKAGGNPSGSTLVTLDSVRNDVLLGWYTYLMQLQSGLTGNFSTRIRAVIKAPPTAPYVIGQANVIDAIWAAQQTAIGDDGRKHYKKQRN